MLSTLLYSLYTHDGKPRHDSNIIIKFADDTTVLCIISDDDESAYRDDVKHLIKWCASNELTKCSKTKISCGRFEEIEVCSFHTYC